LLLINKTNKSLPNDCFNIKLTTIQDVNDFVKDMENFESDIDAIRGRYVLDAKSYMGLLTLDLSIPLTIKIHSINEEELCGFNEIIKKYLH
jgi:hypothetical protein